MAVRSSSPPSPFGAAAPERVSAATLPCRTAHNRHADLLFNIVSSRSRKRSTIITTNRPFSEWGEAFPNASCVVALVDRLVHNAEIIAIDGDSYRRKEAEERQKIRRAERRRRRAGKPGAQDRGEPSAAQPWTVFIHGTGGCWPRPCAAIPSKTSYPLGYRRDPAGAAR